MTEKENELNLLRDELEQSRHTKMADEEQEKRLRRLTVDLETEKLTMKKLEELNAELEVSRAMFDRVRAGWLGTKQVETGDDRVGSETGP